MITVRHIERLFEHHQHPRLCRELIAGRPEATMGVEAVLSRVVPIAALGMIRLDELSQSHTPMYRRLRNVVMTSQQPDGGWGDARTTAVALRALLIDGSGTPRGASFDRREGEPAGPPFDPPPGRERASDRGLRYLANSQDRNGLWSNDPAASAFVLMQLGDRGAFRRSVHFDQAIEWFAQRAKSLDPATRRAWNHAAIRCRVNPADDHSTRAGTLLWSNTADRPAA